MSAARRLRSLRGRLHATVAPHLRSSKDRVERLILPGLRSDMDDDSRTLLVAFGGLRGQIGIPPFEFLTLTGELPVKRMFVRDLYQSWYHQGTLRPRSSSLEGLAELLGELISSHGVERLITVGNSSGGYGALALGTLLGADVVLAFSPQTVLDPDVLAEMGDRRWIDPLQRLVKDGRMDERWMDLRTALPQFRRAPTRYRVYFNDTQRRDTAHAERLRGLDGVQLFRFGHHSGHFLVKTMRETGTLERVLRDAVATPQPADAAKPLRAEQ